MGERNKTVKKERNKTLKKNCFVLRRYPFLFLHSMRLCFCALPSF